MPRSPELAVALPLPPTPKGLRLRPLLGAVQAWEDGETRAGTSTLWTSPAPCSSVWCVQMSAESVLTGGVSRIKVTLEWAQGLTDPGAAPRISRDSVLGSEPPPCPPGTLRWRAPWESKRDSWPRLCEEERGLPVPLILVASPSWGPRARGRCSGNTPWMSKLMRRGGSSLQPQLQGKPRGDGQGGATGLEGSLEEAATGHPGTLCSFQLPVTSLTHFRAWVPRPSIHLQ